MVAPPSLPLIMREGLLGSIHSAWWSPCGAGMRSNDLPPSVERKSPVFAMYIVFALFGSAHTCVKYQARCRKRWSGFTSAQCSPPSSERYNPPAFASMSAYTTFESAPETATPMRPSGPSGMPLPSMRFQVLPSSPERYSASFAPPLLSIQGVRQPSHIAAKSTCGFLGSKTISMAPVRSSRYKTFSQFLPPSRVRNTPRSLLGPYAWPSAATYTMSGLLGWMMSAPMCRVSRKPTFVQVLPAAVDLYTASPAVLVAPM